jgi:hypothetical protein
LLESVVYLYPSEQAAKDGERAGGSGFIVAIQSEMHPESCYLYVVTCRHIVEDAKSRTIRINTLDGKTDIIAYNLEDWGVHPDGHNVAVCAIPAFPHHKVGYIPDTYLLTEELIAQWKIGPGDDAFLMGRFINHEGKQFNTPSLGFGNLSMMPNDPITQDNGHKQLSFVVETHSIGGYSGSPVIVFVPASDRPYRRIDPNLRNGMWLLGLDWGHITQWQPVTRRGNPEDTFEDWGMRYNTLMTGVVPAWQLRELLDIEDFKDMRKELDEHFQKEKVEVPGAL